MDPDNGRDPVSQPEAATVPGRTYVSEACVETINGPQESYTTGFAN